MTEGLIFANARAKAKELNLFSEERLLRMMECIDLKDAVRILYEANYGGGFIAEDETDYESVLTEEYRIVRDFVKESVPVGAGLDCFFLRNDYHNVKALYKSKLGGIKDIQALILPDGIYDLDALKASVERGRFEQTHLDDAARLIEKRFEAGEGTPRLIDTAIDRAMFLDITDRLRNSAADAFIADYFAALIDLTNILTLVRVYVVGGQLSQFAANYLEGGTLDIKVLADCFSDPYAKLPAAMAYTPYAETVSRLEKGSLAVYETALDNYLLKIFAVRKNDMFSAAPVIGYYLAKQNEIKVIRIVLMCIKNKVDKADMKKRVRLLYA